MRVLWAVLFFPFIQMLKNHHHHHHIWTFRTSETPDFFPGDEIVAPQGEAICPEWHDWVVTRTGSFSFKAHPLSTDSPSLLTLLLHSTHVDGGGEGGPRPPRQRKRWVEMLQANEQEAPYPAPRKPLWVCTHPPCFPVVVSAYSSRSRMWPWNLFALKYSRLRVNIRQF